jgi:hypothetical protein
VEIVVFPWIVPFAATATCAAARSALLFRFKIFDDKRLNNGGADGELFVTGPYKKKSKLMLKVYAGASLLKVML